MEIDLEEYRQQFYKEALDILERAYSGILKAESLADNEEVLNSVFRDVHTIKGSAGSFELWKVSDFTHHLEALLASLRDKVLFLNSEIVDIILDSLDYIETLIEHYKNGSTPVLDEKKIESIKKFLLPSDSSFEKVEPISETSYHFQIPDPIKEFIIENRKENETIYYVKLLYTDTVFLNGYDPYALLKNIKKNSILYFPITDAKKVPTFDEFSSKKLYLHSEIFCTTKLTKPEVIDLAFDSELLYVEDITEKLISNESNSSKDTDLENIDIDVLHEFLFAVEELHTSIDSSLLDYEKTKSSESLNKLFRYIHTIKGDAGYIGLQKVVTISHNLETILDKLRSGSEVPTPELIDTLFESLDSIYTHFIQMNTSLNRSTKITNIQRKKEHAEVNPFNDYKNLPPAKKEVFVDQIKQYKDMLPIQVYQMSSNPLAVKNILRMLKTLSVISENASLTLLKDRSLSAIQELEAKEEEQFLSSIDEIISLIDLVIKNKFDLVNLYNNRNKPNQFKEEKETVESPSAQVKNTNLNVIFENSGNQLKVEQIVPLQNQSQLDSKTESTTMKVDESKIDTFYNLIGELIISRNTYDFCLNQIDLSSKEKIESGLKLLKENLHVISRITNEMQRGVMSLRMVPVKSVLQKYYRVVRDVARKQKKEIELTIIGENIEIDKKVADILSDPLVHLIRNACDHGIESSEERLKLGKSPSGSIHIKASYEGNHVVIRIKDDGRGLNKEKIIQKAQKMGIETNLLSEDEIYNLIFLPGLSTADKITDVSGRGVGMDVVQSTARSLGGFVKIFSKLNLGSETIISIPISMGVSKVLMMQADSREYAIPLDSVIETLKVKGTDIHIFQDKMIMYFRGEVVPLESLKFILNGYLSNEEKTYDEFYNQNIEIPIVVLKTSLGSKFAVIVERLNKNMEIAIKPLPKQLGNNRLVSGVTIMGDGGVVQVLNVDNFLTK